MGYNELMFKTALKIEGMSCDHCVRRVQSALQAVPGVTSARVDLASGAAVIEHDKSVVEQSLIAAVAEAGYAGKAHQ